ncbi:MAG TPA: YbaK/EbsC family protein [Anaerolineales bacterium]
MLPSHTYLDHLHIPYTTATFPPSTQKGATNVADILGLRAHQTVKTLIFKMEEGEYVLIMVSADLNVVSGQLKKAVGSRNVKLASSEEVINITGYQIGSIPPFSWQPQGFRSFVDRKLMDEDTLAVGAGVWGNEILITPSNLIKASLATVVNLTNRNQPVFPPA